MVRAPCDGRAGDARGRGAGAGWVHSGGGRAGGAGRALGPRVRVDWTDGELLAAVAGWLAPAVVRVAYPGVWLRDDVYATHGHYGDRHTTVPMLERIGAGTMALIAHEPAGGPRRAEDYESTLAPIYAWIHAVAQGAGAEPRRSTHGYSARAWQRLAGATGRARCRQRALSAAFAALIALLNRRGSGRCEPICPAAELHAVRCEGSERSSSGWRSLRHM